MNLSKKQKKPRKGFTRSSKEWAESVTTHIGKFVDRLPPLKTVAFISGTYLLYELFDNLEVISDIYTTIQFEYGSPLIFALKRFGIFDLPKVISDQAREKVKFDPAVKLALAMIVSYVIVEHGIDLLGMLGKTIASSAGGMP